MNPQRSNPQYNFKEGALLLVDKPIGWTSFDVVNKIRYKLKHKLGVRKIKVGHAGTLDPLATGLLIICTGKFTKKLDSLQGLYKTYTGTIKLGASTPSFDAETEEKTGYPIDHINEELLEAARPLFLGDIEQIPPIYSALKVDGERLYKQARKGISVEIKARPVHIYSFDIQLVEMPYLHFSIKCSKGTYIRSIANDFGKALDSGAYLSSLRRTSIGEHSIDDAWNLEDLLVYIESMDIPPEED
ncbi:MAG: tRNA pseudouridine55 synthase [Saprospiraceae bacterium]|jgi:tRNA pseudouridine55 synthase